MNFRDGPEPGDDPVRYGPSSEVCESPAARTRRLTRAVPRLVEPPPTRARTALAPSFDELTIVSESSA